MGESVVSANLPLNGSSRQTLSEFPVKEDDLVSSWLLVSSPGAVIAVIATYLIFVKYIGPKMMERRKPYELKFIIQPYNLVQIIWNLYVVSLMFQNGAFEYHYNHSCTPLDVNPLEEQMCVGMWHYTVLKFLDLFDTVFFVLRKKQDHVTFLHVYHHTVMALFSWGALKYLRGEQGIPLGFLNSLVHVIMYTYYFLAAFGEQMRPYLWWKRYLTTLQIAQFVMGATFLTSLIIMNCPVPKSFTYVWCSQIIIFLGLFINFYIKAYIKKPTREGELKKEKKH